MPMAHQRTYTQWYTTWMPTGSPTDLHTRTHAHTHNSGAYGHQRTYTQTTWMPIGSPTDLHTQLGCRSPTDLHTPHGCRWLASRRIHTTCMPMVSHGTYTLHQRRFHLTPAGIRDGNFVSVSPPAVLTSRSSCQHLKHSISDTPHGFHRNYANQLRSASRLPTPPATPRVNQSELLEAQYPGVFHTARMSRVCTLQHSSR